MNEMVNLIPTCIVSNKKTIPGWFFSILKNNVYACIEEEDDDMENMEEK
jgi:hypothetical protein